MSNPLKKSERRCYESQHMHPREWGLLHVLQRVTKGCKATLFFDGPTIAGWFSGDSKSSIYRSAARLVRDGWLIPLNGGGKKRQPGSKRFEATQYRVLDHAQWIKTHKGKCKPFPNEGTESIPKVGNGPFPNEGTVHSHFDEKPFPIEGRSSVIPCSVKTNSVKACSVEGRPDFSFLTSGQDGSGEATLSTAPIPTSGNGDHTLQTVDALRAKLEHFSKHGGCEPEQYKALREQVESLSKGVRQ
jgi:hypothetical protein